MRPGAHGTGTAHVDGWHGYVKPRNIYFGNGAAPFITNLTWKSWGAGSAWGTGKLWVIKPGCTPHYKCPYTTRWVGLSMSTVRKHGAQPYYARMAAEFFISGKKTWDVGWLKYAAPGATVPMWVFPATYPYL